MFELNYPAVLIVIFVSLVLKDLVMLAVQVLFVSERIFLYLILILIFLPIICHMTLSSVLLPLSVSQKESRSWQNKC